MRSELNVLFRGPVLAALLLTVVSSSAMFTVFTYIAPILQVETQAGAGFVTSMLILYGLGYPAVSLAGAGTATAGLVLTLMFGVDANRSRP